MVLISRRTATQCTAKTTITLSATSAGSFRPSYTSENKRLWLGRIEASFGTFHFAVLQRSMVQERTSASQERVFGLVPSGVDDLRRQAWGAFGGVVPRVFHTRKVQQYQSTWQASCLSGCLWNTHASHIAPATATPYTPGTDTPGTGR